jgi:hypothetical protein
VVTHTWKIFYTTTAHQNDAVFLQIVTFTTDVSDDFEFVGQTYLGHFAQSRVRLLWSGGVNLGTYSSALRTGIKRWTLGFEHKLLTAFAHKLLNGRHLKDFLYVGFKIGLQK